MLCSISGEPPSHPVLSPSGHVYEKSLIETYISQNGTDPVSGEPLSEQDLVEIKSSHIAKPKPPTATSIPSLLGSFQSEWDAMALEIFSLRKQLVETKQQLSSALYHNDAAVRVVARITEERDEARTSLAQLAASIGQPLAEASMDIDSNGNAHAPSTTVSLPYASDIAVKKSELSSARKKGAFKVDSETWATSDDISQFKETIKTKQFFTTVLRATSIVSESGRLQVLTGGGKNSAGIFDPESKAIISNISTGGKVTSVATLPEHKLIAVGLKSGVVQLFAKNDNGDEYAEIKQYSAHKTASVELVVLPYNNVIVSGGADGTWSFINPDDDTVVSFSTGSSGVSSVAVHPDGGLLALGTEGSILIYDLTGDDIAEPVAVFDANGEQVTSLHFAENGKWLASAAGTAGVVSIWHLGKIELLTTVTYEQLLGAEILRVSFDNSSNLLLAASSKGVEIAAFSKETKDWVANQFSSAAAAVDAVWGANAKSVVSVSSKGIFHVYAL